MPHECGEYEKCLNVFSVVEIFYNIHTYYIPAP